MRRAVTIIELMIVLAICAMVAVLVIGNLAGHRPGTYVMARGKMVVIVTRDMKTTPITYIVRDGNTEYHVEESEMSPCTEAPK